MARPAHGSSALPLLATLLSAGCAGPIRHVPIDPRWLDPATGRASPAVAVRAADAPLRIAVYGDTRNGREAHRKVVAAIRAAHPDLVVYTGDALACLPVGHLPDFGWPGYLIPFWPQVLRGYPAATLASLVPFPALVHEAVGSLVRPLRDPSGFNAFLEDTAPLRLEDRVPLLFVPGNHDEYHRADREELTSRILPSGAPGTAFFAVDAGPARLVVLDSGTDLFGDADPLGPEQLAWLDRTLQGAEDEGRTPVVFVHLPPFSSGREDGPSPAVRQRVVEGVLDRHAVPLVASGHAHAYERIERAGPAGSKTTFVVTGGGGAPFHHRAPEGERDPGSVAFVEGTLHFVLLDVEGRRIRGRLVAVDGDASDEFDAGANRGPPSPAPAPGAAPPR